MYEITQITQDKNHFFIYRDDDCVKVQRKHVIYSTHSPLTSDEELIIALCRWWFSSSIMEGELF